MQPRYDMVSCFVIRADKTGRLGEILQLRRAPDEYLPGVWTTVRGSMEAGEKAWEAALRELREETGIVPTEFYALNTVDTFYLAANDSVMHLPGFCAVVNADQQVTLNEEHDAVRWIDRTRIDEDFIWPGERAQLREVCREIMDNGPARSYLRVAVKTS